MLRVRRHHRHNDPTPMKRLSVILLAGLVLTGCMTFNEATHEPPMPPQQDQPRSWTVGTSAQPLTQERDEPETAERTFNLYWDYWNDGVIWNTVVTQWPVRLGVWYSTDWSLPAEQWTRIVDESDASVTNATVTLPWSEQGFFRSGYSWGQ